MMNFAKNLMVVALASVATLSANAALTYGEQAISQPYVGLKGGQIVANGADKSLLSYGAYAGYNFDKHFGFEVEYQTTENKQYDKSGISEIPRWADVGRGRLDPSDDSVAILIDDKHAVEIDGIKKSTEKVKSHVQTYGAYGTYHHNLGDSPFYVKAKLGAARVDYYTTDEKNLVALTPFKRWVEKKDNENAAGTTNQGGQNNQNNTVTIEEEQYTQSVLTTLIDNKKVHKTGLAGGIGIGYQPIPMLGIELGYNYLTHEATGYNLSVQLSF